MLKLLFVSLSNFYLFNEFKPLNKFILFLRQQPHINVAYDRKGLFCKLIALVLIVKELLFYLKSSIKY